MLTTNDWLKIDALSELFPQVFSIGGNKSLKLGEIEFILGPGYDTKQILTALDIAMRKNLIIKMNGNFLLTSFFN